jgi:ribosomal protein S18 acetylase RimI-like enzyme
MMKIKDFMSMYKKRILLVIGLAVLVGGVVQWYFWQHKTAVLVQTGPIYDFDDARDTQEILNLFEANWHWLVATPDYSPAYMLKYRAPNQTPLSHGKLSIKVLREKDTFVGFIAYYKKKPQEGFILFVAVKEEFRGKRYAEKLIHYAINDMKEQGVKSVWLITRLSNARAQALYRRLGFYELQHDDIFIYFQRDL